MNKSKKELLPSGSGRCLISGLRSLMLCAPVPLKKAENLTSGSSYIITVLLIAVITTGTVIAQHDHGRYVPETDPLVLEKLEKWQDIKFGLLMHWGPYSQWGIVESWSICPEDEGWTQRGMDNYVEYVRQYENLQTTFNPVRFDPERWAKAAGNAGMRYVVFTTKHHDGFSMFDTEYTDYSITGGKTPFSSHPGANLTKEIFDAFRAEGL